MSKFTRRQLEEQIGFSREDADFILDFQNKVPVLFDYFEDEVDENEFIVNARDLWVQLGEPQGKFADWVKRKLVNKTTKTGSNIFIQNKDYCTISQKCEIANTKGYKEHLEYLLTIDCSKNIAMMENTDNGALCRQYFITMEKAIKKIKSWTLTREPLKRGYKVMDSALNKYIIRNFNREADKYDYSAEANALNIIATGFTAAEIRNIVGCRDNITRDSLTEIYNSYLLKLQEQNTIFLGMNFSRYQRYKMLLDTFNILFPYPTVFKNYNGNQIVKRKEKFLEEIKEKYGE